MVADYVVILHHSFYVLMVGESFFEDIGYLTTM